MKRNILIVAIAFFLSSFTQFAGLGEVISNIRTGNASAISKYFDNTIEISVQGKSNGYSKTQGEAVLRDFFKNHPVKAFTIVHQGESGGSQFAIGTLVTANGTFRTTVNLKLKGDKQTLQEIKFDN